MHLERSEEEPDACDQQELDDEERGQNEDLDVEPRRNPQGD